MEFTYNGLYTLIRTLLECDYNIIPYGVPCDGKKVIMRHDVDNDLKKAAEFAEVENQISKGKVVSTYFVLLSSPFYNLFTKESRDYLRRIIVCGNEIGLHFDETQYDTGDIHDQVAKEARVLSDLIGQQVSVVSMHRPSKHTLDANYSFNGLINSYSQEYFKEWKYISDSRMCWREDAFEIISSNQYNRLHILTHPFWYTETNETTSCKLNRFINEARINRYDDLSKNFRDLNDFVDRSALI